MEKVNTEAHRLITMSLGKIAASRVQRGGVNLHKSLLVSAVLHKARNAYMMGNLQALMQSRKVAQERKLLESENNTQDQQNNSCMESAQNIEAGKQRTCDQGHVATSIPFSDNNKENTQPCTKSNMESEKPDYSDNTNNNLSDVSNKNTDKLSSGNGCGKCTKRRLTLVPADNVNVGVSDAKKWKSDCSNNQVSDQHEPMQTESPQITNLVSSFNSGFTGLLNGNGTTPNMQGQGHSEQSYSCSSQTVCGQIKEGFESLARPIIALAV